METYEFESAPATVASRTGSAMGCLRRMEWATVLSRAYRGGWEEEGYWHRAGEAAPVHRRRVQTIGAEGERPRGRISEWCGVEVATLCLLY